jgi:hypothetical protein
MQHLYNVLEPLAADQPTQQTLQAFIDCAFDGNIINSNSVLALNLQRQSINGDFRMNERIFRHQLCSTDAQAKIQHIP